MTNLTNLSPFSLCFDDDVSKVHSLPEAIRQIYGGDWQPREIADRPYIYSNFVVSRDGRISFNEPGHPGGGDVSGFNPHDRWLMALLRARADAVIVGDNTLRLEPHHLWTAEYIFPEDAQPFTTLRQHEGRRPYPYQIFLSLTGELDPAATVFQQPELEVIIATTHQAKTQAEQLEVPAQLTVRALGDAQVDLHRLARVLHHDFGIHNLLCEGGPRVYGAFIAAGLIDDEFLTLSPTVIGQAEHKRPGLVEGVAFTPDAYPKSVPVSLRRAGAHLFLRSSYHYPAE
jgi:riboflavin biosynthesis pyrimidine reductase